VGAVKTWID